MLTRGRFGSLACEQGVAVSAPLCIDCTDLHAADRALSRRLADLGITVATFDPLPLDELLDRLDR